MTMFIYLLVWGASIAFAIFASALRLPIKLTLSVFFIFFIFFIGFRHAIGADWWNYIEVYENITSMNTYEALWLYEPGYVLLNLVSSQNDFGIYIINFICAVIFLCGLFRFCLIQSQPLVAFLISIPYLVIVVGMGYTRQSAALGFVLLGYSILNPTRPFPFIAMLLLASLFHRSALLLLILCPLIFRLSISRKKLVAIAFSILIFLFYKYEIIFGLFDVYIINEMESEGGSVRLILNLLAAFFFFLRINYYKKYCIEKYSLYSCLATSVIVLFIASFALPSTAIDRFSLYLAPLQLVVFSTPLPSKFSSIKYLYIMSIFYGYTAMLAVWLIKSPWASCCWLPYKNIIFY